MKFVNSLFVAAALTGGLLVLRPAQAFEGDISPTIPQQCATTTVTVANDSVLLPLHLLLIPYGGPDAASNPIYEIPFNDHKIDFQLKYPAGTQFIYLVSAMLLHNPRLGVP